MSNPFDRFDEPTQANPFDRFDAPDSMWDAMRSFQGNVRGELEGMAADPIASKRKFIPTDFEDEAQVNEAFALNEWLQEAGFQGIGMNDDHMVTGTDPRAGQAHGVNPDHPGVIQAQKLWAIDQYEKAGKRAPKPKGPTASDAARNFAVSAVDTTMQFPGIGDLATAGIDAVAGDYIEGGTDEQFRQAKATAREETPMASLAGDLAGYAGGGVALFRGGANLLRGAGAAAISPRVAQALTPSGTSFAAKMGRYVPQVVVPSSIAAGVDYGIYEGTAGARNVEADTGRRLSFNDRVGRALEYMNPIEHPEGYAFGAAASPVYRGLRGTAASAKNTVTSSLQRGRFSPQGGGLTPTNRANDVGRALQEIQDQRVARDPESRAFRMIAKRLDADEISQEDLMNALTAYRYGGYSSVEEMLYELANAATNDTGAGQINQLVRALATVGGDAQSFGRTQGAARSADSALRIREDMRKAAGLSGDDFEQYGGQLRQASRELPAPLYEEAWNVQISDDSFRNGVLPIFTDVPSAKAAIPEAADYAIGRARSQQELVIARRVANELSQFSDQLDDVAAGKIGIDQVQPISTQGYDYIIRMLGDTAVGIRRGSGRSELAAGVEGAAYRLRSIVDPQTGLGDARALSRELINAQKALDYGTKAASNNKPLRDLQSEFKREMQLAADNGLDNVFDDALEGSTINTALLMGYMRGAEDIIEKASNPSTAIRQLYGSARQRAKMKEMLMGLDETAIARAGAIRAANPEMSADEVARIVASERGATSTGQQASTKRLRQVVGDKYRGSSQPDRRYEQGHVLTQGRPDREIRMIENSRDLFNKSPTGRNNAAVAEEGGNQRLAEQLYDSALKYIMDPKRAVQDAGRMAVRRATMPGIYDPQVNRELGQMLFQGGSDDLERIINQLAPYRAANRPPTAAAGQGAPNAPGGANASAAAPQAAQAGFADGDLLRALLPPAAAGYGAMNPPDVPFTSEGIDGTDRAIYGGGLGLAALLMTRGRGGGGRPPGGADDAASMGIGGRRRKEVMRELRDKGAFPRAEPDPNTPEGMRRRQLREQSVSSDGSGLPSAYGETMDGEAVAAIIGTLGLMSAGTYQYLDDKAYRREKKAEEEARAKKQSISSSNELALDRQRASEGFPPVPGVKPDSMRDLVDDLTSPPDKAAGNRTEDGKLLRYEGREAYVFDGGVWRRAAEYDR